MSIRIVNTTITNTSDAYTLLNSGDVLFVGSSGLIGSTNGWGVNAAGASSQTVNVAGAITGFIGVHFDGNDARLLVSEGGNVSGQVNGAYFTKSAQVTNAGTIHAAVHGILAEQALTVHNYGLISGADKGIFASKTLSLVNYGDISGGRDALSTADQTSIVNFGSLTGAVVLSFLDDTITNSGLITGFINCGDGDDVIDSSGGVLVGTADLGRGNDTYLGGAGSDTVDGHRGNDDISGNGGNDIVLAQIRDGDDRIDGGTGIDTYDARGLTLAVSINLGTGTATAVGSIDTLDSIENAFGGSASDQLTGSASDNRLSGLGGNDVLLGAGGNDVLRGGDGNNTMDGGDGNDRLVGGDFLDQMIGGSGADVLINSFDIDRFTGGAGADRFVFSEFEEFFPNTGSGFDRVTDFAQGQDLFDFKNFTNNGTAFEGPFIFIGTGPFTAIGQIGYRTTANATFIQVSVNTADAFDAVRLDGVFTLTAADFIL